MTVGASDDVLTSEGTRETTKLHRRALGVPDIVFFIVAASAPLTAVAGGQAVSYLVTGNRGIPFLFIPLGIVLILFAAGYAAMSHHMTSAGAFYAYVAQGLGKVAGVGTAFVALIAYNAMQIGIYGLFGVAFGAFMDSELGISLDWWAWCFIAWGVIAVLGVLQVDLNAKVLAVLLILETLVVLLFDIAVAADPGPQGLTFVPFDPTIALGTAVGAALAFCMASFVGFESGAIYSEECRNPRRTVARATYIAVALVAACYAISSWLLAVSIGPDTIVDPEALVAGGFATAGAPDPTTVLIGSGTERLGSFWGDSALLLFGTSLFAALISFHNAVARYVFSLGRESILPPVFGRVQERTGAPYVGSISQSVLAIAVLAIFALADEDPVLTLFTWLTNLGALGVILLLALASFAVVRFFQRHPEFGEGTYSRRIAPTIAGVCLSAMFIVALLNFNVLITGATDAPLDEKSIMLPAILIGGGLAGLALGLALRARNPAVYARIGEGGSHD
jgi:amino acid transporter